MFTGSFFTTKKPIQVREEFFKHVTRKQLLSDLEEELGLEFKDNTEKLKQIDGAIKENKRS